MKLSDIKLCGETPLCWSDIKATSDYQSKTQFFNGSTSQHDPRFYYIAILEEEVDEAYLTCYFDKNGEWVTQSVHGTFVEAIDHNRYLFGIEEYDWFWHDHVNPSELGMNI